MIPNKIHFIFGLEENFGKKPFSLAHYLAVLSAYYINKPEEIIIHCRYIPDNIWWNKIQSLVTIRQVDIPQEIFGIPLMNYAHKSDVLRLEILLNEGGIYLDIDMICRNSFCPLLHHPVVMGIEEYQDGNKIVRGLCNAVIMAEKDSLFLKEWYNSYKSFRGTTYGAPYWNEHPVIIPGKLAKKRRLKKKIHIEPTSSFFTPNWQHISTFFTEEKQYPDAYCHHLWESATYEDFLSTLTLEKIAADKSAYAHLAREILALAKADNSSN